VNAALRGGVCVSNTRGSTVEARGRKVLHIKAKTRTVSRCDSSRSAESDGGVARCDCSYSDGRNASVPGTLLGKALVGPMGSKVRFARRSGHLRDAVTGPASRPARYRCKVEGKLAPFPYWI